MTDHNATYLDPIRFLKGAVALWASVKQEPNALEKLRPYLAESFDTVDFHNHISAIVKIDRVETTPLGGAIIYFHDEADFLQRAVLRRAASGGWVLESLKFECPICFGTGCNDDECCTMCGGSGWGAS